MIGPDWIHNRYDIVAKAAGPVSKDQLKLIVQTLLEDWIKLKVHREIREVRLAVLIASKNGPKNLLPADKPMENEGRPLSSPLMANWCFRGPWPILRRFWATARPMA